MTPKLFGCCSKCDVEVFDIVERKENREPNRAGAPHDDAVRLTFILVDGTRMDLTFCKPCADTLSEYDYAYLWQRVMLSWAAESPGHPHQKSQVDNGIMALSHRQPWKEVA